MKNILVTAIGSMSSECVISGLRRLGWHVFGTDIYPREYHPVVAQCAGFFQVPRADQSGFVEALMDIAKSNSIEYILPLTDPEIDTLASHRTEFDRCGIRILMAPNEVLAICRDKDKIAKVLTGCRTFKTIPTYSSLVDAVSNSPGSERFVAKKVNGRSSEGILFGSAKEFSSYNLRGYVIQPFISGSIVTVDVASDGKGSVAVCPRVELLRTKNGAGTVVRAEDDQLFLPMAREIVLKLGVIGCMNFEFIQAEDGFYYLMDINPRYSAGVGFSAIRGFDVVSLHLGSFGLLDFIAPDLQPSVGCVYVKRFSDYIGGK